MARILGKKVRSSQTKQNHGRTVKPMKTVKQKRLDTRDKRHNRNQKINKWTPENMQGAVDEYHANNGKVSVRQLARAWNVPRSTLMMRIEGKVKGTSHMSGRKPLFDADAEDQLVSVIKDLSQRGFPLGMKEVRLIAYSYASEKGIKGFSAKKKTAGYEWLYSFLRRNSDIGIRTPEPLSIARAMGMNEPVVKKWFSDLETSIDQLGIRCMPNHFWNVDETGLQDYFVPQKVIGEVGKPCYQATASEKGETTTIIAAFNAMGNYVKPLVIMRGKRLKAEWLEAIPDGMTLTLRMSDNGWVNKDLFMTWAEMFVASLPKDGKPHLLFLDGHGSHVYNLDFIELMRKNNVQVWCLPAHTTHCLQPADKTFFRSLKHHWNEEGLKLARISAGAKLTRSEFLRVFAAAWKQSSTTENAMSGFCSTGLFPLNPDKINRNAFLPSQTTERQLPCQLTEPRPTEHQQVPDTNEHQPAIAADLQLDAYVTPDHQQEPDASEPQLVTASETDNQQCAAGPVELHLDISVSVDHQLGAAAEDENLSSVTTVQPTACVSGMNHAQSDSEEAVPPPTQCPEVVPDEVPSHNDFYNFVTVPQRVNRTSGRRKKMPTYHLTSAEHIDFVTQRQQPKIMSKVPNKSADTCGKRKRGPTKQKPKKVMKNSTQPGDDEDLETCLYCSEVYGSTKWVKCQECSKWAHFECAGVDDNVYNFVCDLCT